MAYSNFKLRQLKQQFQLEEKGIKLFSDIKLLESSEWLKKTLSLGLKMPLLSEKARSERIVSPILFELWQQNHESFGIFSGFNLEADIENGLNGECDFIIASRADTYTVESPIFMLIEAKDNDIKLGIPQCIAQMLGARLYNQQDENEIKIIYGCVTTGDDWQFLKLMDNTIYIDIERYYLDNVPQLLGILQSIVDCYKSVK